MGRARINVLFITYKFYFFLQVLGKGPKLYFRFMQGTVFKLEQSVHCIIITDHFYIFLFCVVFSSWEGPKMASNALRGCNIILTRRNMLLGAAFVAKYTCIPNYIGVAGEIMVFRRPVWLLMCWKVDTFA